jgi:hypothetical protein
MLGLTKRFGAIRKVRNECDARPRRNLSAKAMPPLWQYFSPRPLAPMAAPKGHGPHDPSQPFPCKVGAFWGPTERGHDRLHGPLVRRRSELVGNEPHAPVVAVLLASANQFGTTLSRVGGSAGAPSAVASLNRNAAILTPSLRGPDGRTQHIRHPGAVRPLRHPGAPTAPINWLSARFNNTRITRPLDCAAAETGRGGRRVHCCPPRSADPGGLCFFSFLDL